MVKVVELNLGALACVCALLYAMTRTDDSVTNRDRMSEVSAQAWHSDSGGSSDPTGGSSGALTAMGRDVLRQQFRIPPASQCS